MIKIVTFSDRPFHQHGTPAQLRYAPGVESARIILRQVGHGMMGDPASVQGPWPHLHRSYPSRLGHRNIRHRPPPHVLVMRRHRIWLGLDDEIGLAEFLRRSPVIVPWPVN